MSLPADCGPGGKDNPGGVSFLMGIDHRTGVPFQCMQDPTIANLWMTLREAFLEISHDRVKGCKLTNIKIAINSADTRVNSHSADLGLATVWLKGSLAIPDHISVSLPPSLRSLLLDLWRLHTIRRVAMLLADETCVPDTVVFEQLRHRPKAYFLKALLGRGIKLDPVAFNNPRSKITCVALKYLTTDKLPQMYDKALLSLMYEGSLEDIRSRVAPEGKLASNLANAQNANGETVLMKVCRRALSTNCHSPLAVVGLLLRAGANPMVCCDSGKNVLHDLFWSAKPPPPDVLQAMEAMVDMIHECTGRETPAHA